MKTYDKISINGYPGTSCVYIEMYVPDGWTGTIADSTLLPAPIKHRVDALVVTEDRIEPLLARMLAVEMVKCLTDDEEIHKDLEATYEMTPEQVEQAGLKYQNHPIMPLAKAFFPNPWKAALNTAVAIQKCNPDKADEAYQRVQDVVLANTPLIY